MFWVKPKYSRDSIDKSLFIKRYWKNSTISTTRDPSLSKFICPYRKVRGIMFRIELLYKAYRDSHEVCSLQVPPDDAAHELIGVGEVLQ